MNKSRYLAIFYIFFGILIVYFSSQIKTMFSVASEDTGPKFFPYICGVCMCLCGIGKFISSKGKNDKPFLKNKKDWLRLILISFILVAYAILIKYLGYIVSSVILLTILAILLADKNKLKWWQVILFAVITVTVIYVMFFFVLRISLPEGIWIKAIRKLIR